MIDSLVAFLSGKSSNLNDAYYYARSISPPLNIFPHDGTIQQLKNSGNLRLIRKKNVSNSIMAYDQMVRQVLFEMGDEVEIRAEYRIMARKVFDSKVFYEIIAGETMTRPTGNPPMMTSDPILINEMIGVLQYTKRVHQAQLIRSIQLYKQSKELINEILNKYKLG